MNKDFIVEQLKKHKLNLEENFTPRYVDLSRDLDGVSVTWKQSEKRVITEFPVGRSTIKTAPVVIYEEPIKGLPYATYVCGIDPYNQDTSSNDEPSLGVCYIMKRMYDPFGNFQNSIVASYAGRPESLNEFYQICEMMIEMYEALALPENEGSIIQYFIQRKKEHLLFDSPALTRYISASSATANRQKGLAATTPNQKHYMNLMLEYANEITEEQNGTEIHTKLGLVKIPDSMLLEEMLSYKGKASGTQRGVHGGNYDRICAFGHCLALANYLDRDFPILGKMNKSEEKKKYPKIISPFIINERDPNNTRIISPFDLRGITRSF